MSNLECSYFVESGGLNLSRIQEVKFTRIWCLEFHEFRKIQEAKFDRIRCIEFCEIQLPELSNILVSGFAQNSTGAVTQHKTWPPLR